MKSHTWRRVSSGTGEKLLGDGAGSKLRRRHWSEIIAAREKRKPLRKLLTHCGDAVMITGKYFRYWTYCEETEDITFNNIFSAAQILRHGC